MNGNKKRFIVKIPSRLFFYLFCIVLCPYVPCVLCGDYKTCDDVGTFQQFMNFSRKMCSDECAGRQRCKVFMIRQEMNYCSLKDNIDITSLDKGHPICGYFERDESIPEDIGPCNGQPCDKTERCKRKRNNKFECSKTECLEPKLIENAKLLSNTHRVGTTNRYKCTNGLVGRGIPSIVCMKNGTWSETDFECVLPTMACPELKQEYFNSIRTKVDKVGYTGTVLTYTCKNGYNKLVDEINITCQKSGKWNRKRITCCHDNTTDILSEECYAILNGGLISSYQEAFDYCQTVGGGISWASYHAKDLFNKETTTFVLTKHNKSFTNEKWEYEKCASLNGAIANPIKTFDERVNKVREEMWFGEYCEWGTQFLPGQPDGGDAEQCLCRDLNQFFKFFDTQCTFQQKNVGFICQFSLPGWYND